MVEGHRRFIATAQIRVEDMLSKHEEIARLAIQNPEDVFIVVERLKKPEAYAIMAGVYRSMLEKGEGDQELVARLQDECLARSADYLGIAFSQETPKLRATYKSRPGVPRAKGTRAVYRKK